MKKIVYLVMCLSMCMTVNLYAQSKKQLREMNGTLQHQADSLVGVNDNLARQNAELQRQIDSITNVNNSLNIMNEQLKNMNQELSEQILQEAEQQRQANERQAYVKNKKYYVTKDKKYCEERSLCKEWASNMAQEMGASFKIVSLSKEDSYVAVSHQEDEMYGGPHGEVKFRTNTVHDYDALTSIVNIQYVLNNTESSKTFKCTAKRYFSKTSNWTCNWI